jgi:undecaprenyl-phosphate galactose phosphotransferase
MNINKINYSSYILFILLLGMDLFALIFSLKFALFLRTEFFKDILPFFETESIESYYWILIIVLFMFIVENIYFIRHDFWGDTKRIFKGLMFSAFAVFAVLTLSKISDEYSRSLLIMFFVNALVFVPFFKRVFKRVLFKIDFFKLKVKLLAKGANKDILVKEIEDNWYFGFKLSDLDYDMLLISSKNFEISQLQKIIKQYTSKTKDIYVIPYMDHLDFSYANIIDYSNIRVSAIHIENRLLNDKNIFIKYIFEKLLVIFIFPFALVLHFFIYILIKLDSKGSVIFKQKRLGKDSRIFSCYKYRTMYENNQEMLDEYLLKNPDEIQNYEIYCKYKNDPRITKIGTFLRKTSLDEFPQFYNILRGDMNLIGPRPYMVSEKKKIGKFNEEIILKVRPGITGLWQVSGRNELTFNQRVNLDTWYIQNWSLWMDFVIFMKTIKVVLLKVGAK